MLLAIDDRLHQSIFFLLPRILRVLGMLPPEYLGPVAWYFNCIGMIVSLPTVHGWWYDLNLLCMQ